MVKIEKWLNHEIRFVNKDTEWQAIAKDIADALEYSDTNKMLKRINKEYQSSYLVTDKDISKIREYHQNGGHLKKFTNHNYTTLTELGIYQAIMRSNKPQAKEFQEWIYTTIQNMRQDQGLEQYQAFKMLDKEHQRKAMQQLKDGLIKPTKEHYIKANLITNKALKLFYKLDKVPNKKDLTTEQLAKREEILNATIKLIITKETLQLDNLHVSKVIYQKYSN